MNVEWMGLGIKEYFQQLSQMRALLYLSLLQSVATSVALDVGLMPATTSTTKAYDVQVSISVS